MTEFELIARLTAQLPAGPSVIVGVGDDCAVLDLGHPDKWFLYKTDAVVEGVHFTTDAPPEKVGRKALARCLSDVAAMAGRPTHALVTMALPRSFDSARVEAVFNGIKALAAEHQTLLVGGETTTCPERMLISIALLGEVERGKAVLRSGAQAGDAIFVTGELGGSLSGKHLDFEPRLAEAAWLAGHFSIHSMIDLSDGLAGDLPHILKASQVGAELLSKTIPISRAAKLHTRRLTDARASFNPSGGEHLSAKAPLEAALTDGEDFELLFTVAAKDAVPLLDQWKQQFPKLRLSCIGKITAESGLRIRSREGLKPLEAHGYVHFA